MLFNVLLLALLVGAQAAPPSNEDCDYTLETVTYKYVGEHGIKADVYRCPGDEIRPAILWIHGGALIFGSRTWIEPEQLSRYLTAGYTVIAIDYRLAPETKLAAIVEDLEDAYNWMRSAGRAELRIDPDRIGVVGHSAGGYLTLLAGFRLRPRPDALVSFYGYGDISGPWYAEPDSFYNEQAVVTKKRAFQAVGDLGISGAAATGRDVEAREKDTAERELVAARSDVISSTVAEDEWKERFLFYLYCRQNGLWPDYVVGHHPTNEQAWFLRYEPLRNVTSEYPPTLLLHGEDDSDVPFEQSVKMAEALHRESVEHELISREDWWHGFDELGMEDPHVRVAFDRVIDFLDSHLKR